MALALSSLVSYLRVIADDNDVNLQEYTDEQLANQYLRCGAVMQEASWDQGYTVVANGNSYDITPDPPSWLQILIVLKTALGMKIFQEKYSYDNGIIKTTNTSKKEDLQGLQFLYDEIIQERKYGCPGYAYNTWDDYFSRSQLILNKISEGFG